jgi:hypothetical protein
VKHTIDTRQPFQRGGHVEITNVGRHPQRTQFSGALGTADHPNEPGLSGISLNQPLGDIAKPYDQDFLHHACSSTPVVCNPTRAGVKTPAARAIIHLFFKAF